MGFKSQHNQMVAPASGLMGGQDARLTTGGRPALQKTKKSGESSFAGQCSQDNIRRAISINHPAGDLGVAVDAAVTKERPVAADIFHCGQIDFADQNFFLVVRRFGDDAAKRIAKERASPKLEAVSGCCLAAYVSGFVSDAVYHGHEHSVRNGMGALNGAPGVVLSHSELGFLRGMPANRGGIKKQLRTLQCRKARTFGIPLVPAHQSSDASDAGIDGAIAEVAGGEVILFVIKRVVGNVHLAIKSAQSTVRVESHGSIVVDARGALFEQRSDQYDAKLLGQGGQADCDGPGNGLRQIKQAGIFALTKILCLKQFRQADDLARRARKPDGPCRWLAANSCRDRASLTSAPVRP